MPPPLKAKVLHEPLAVHLVVILLLAAPLTLLYDAGRVAKLAGGAVIWLYYMTFVVFKLHGLCVLADDTRMKMVWARTHSTNVKW